MYNGKWMYTFTYALFAEYVSADSNKQEGGVVWEVHSGEVWTQDTIYVDGMAIMLY